MKFYKLCDSASSYCLKLSVYIGKSKQTPATIGMLWSEAVVINLVGDCLADGHTVYMDNWYPSPLLFLHIHQAGSSAVGTVRVHRKNMSKEVKNYQAEKRCVQDLLLARRYGTDITGKEESMNQH